MRDIAENIPIGDMKTTFEELTQPKSVKLVLDQVSKSFRTGRNLVQALDNISFEVADGEFLCVVGPSGCGKSTLLSIIAGLEPPDTGQILLEGKPIPGAGRDRMVMFQEPSLFPWLSLLGNVMFGLKLKPNLPRKACREIAEFYLRLVGLEKFMHANIHELSGGMKQRAALARALAPNPAILLMDEPFVALDALTREQFYGDIQRIWQERRKTIVFVTHNVREAVCLGDRVLLFSASPGRIRETYRVDLQRPRDINSIQLASYAADITRTLKGYPSESKEHIAE